MSKFRLYAGTNTNDQDARYVLIGSKIECLKDHTSCASVGLIRDLSDSLESFSISMGRALEDSQLADRGDHTGASLIRTVMDVRNQGQFPIIFGGSHSSTIALIEVLRSYEVCVIFDAHSDFYRVFNESSISHACVVRALFDQTSLDLILIGLRDCSKEHYSELRTHERITVITMDDHRSDDRTRSIERIRQICRGRQIFASIDLDVFDPAVTPAVSTPVPDGLTYQEVQGYLDVIIEAGTLLGCDIQEMSVSEHVSFGAQKQTALVVCSLIRDLIGAVERSSEQTQGI